MAASSSLKKYHLVITAGPTREMLDPVRFLSNVSTGQMGYETARQAIKRGFRVTLISGPTALSAPKGVRLIPVLTAAQMKKALFRLWRDTDILIMTAAVCDYTPVQFSPSKIKRLKQKTIRFKRTEDILQSAGKQKGNRLIVGFALETEHVEENAVRKLKQKNLDFIVANWYGKKNNPFGQNKTSMIFIHKSGAKRRFDRLSKPQAAQILLRSVEQALGLKNS